MPVNSDLNGYVESYAGVEGRALIGMLARDFPGRVAVMSSFGAESAVLLHMVAEVAAHLPVIFLDTEKLFPETLAYRDLLIRELGLNNVRIVKPDPNDLRRIDPDGKLHKNDTDLCCHVRKTVPMDAVMGGVDVMISGRKRFHGATRASLDFVTLQDGRLKAEPLAGYSSLDLHGYMQQHHLPSHPLKLRGYRSIGCMPCTSVGGTDEDPRAGRWSGSDKTECGIHFSANGTVIRTDQRNSPTVGLL
jgi:phosphoadenosine phosphosulfate reductase